MAIRIAEELRDSTYLISQLLEDQYVGAHYQKRLYGSTTVLSKPVRKAYLIISATLEEPFNSLNKWKIVLNGVALTREYNPHIEREFMNGIHSVFVYDVTSVVKESEVRLELSYDGKERIKIDTATLITLHEYPKMHTFIEGLIDLVPLENNYSMNYGSTESFEPNEAKLYIGLNSFRQTRISVLDVSGKELYSGILPLGFYLLELAVEARCRNFVVQPSAPAAKHMFNILTLTYAKYPKIVVENVEMSGSRIKATISNVGESDAEDVMLVVLKLGATIAHKRVGTLQSGERKDVELELRDVGLAIPRRILRVIWRYGGKLFTHDITLST